MNFDERQAFWAKLREGLPKTPEGEWAARVRAFRAAGFHDFFTGPGPLLTAIPKPETPYEDRYSYVEHERQLTIVEAMLKAAIEAAGLQGKIQLMLRQWKTHRGDMYIQPHVVFLDWNLLPQTARRWQAQHPDRVDYLSPDDQHRILQLCAAWSSGENTVNGPFRLLLEDLDHPLHPYLLAVMRSDDGGPLAIWKAWSLEKESVDYPGYWRSTPKYDEIPQWPETILNVDNVLDTLEAGVVVVWPPTGKRVRIKLDRHEDIRPAEWIFDTEGAQVLHIAETDDSLTEAFGERRAEQLQVFGEGSTQQEPQIPTLPGFTTVCLMTWCDPADFRVTITVSVDASGKPLYAWVDSSAT